jgi:hypothetical protein
MPEEVLVTPSQVKAARRIVDRDSAKGRETSEAIRKIADARSEAHSDNPTSRYAREVAPTKKRDTGQDRDVPGSAPTLYLPPREQADRPMPGNERDRSPLRRGSTTAPGLKTKMSNRQELAAELKKRYDAGESIRSLAAAVRRSYGYVYRVLSESGVSLRGRGGFTRGKARGRH